MSHSSCANRRANCDPMPPSSSQALLAGVQEMVRDIARGRPRAPAGVPSNASQKQAARGRRWKNGTDSRGACQWQIHECPRSGVLRPSTFRPRTMARIASSPCGREARPRFQNAIRKQPEVPQIHKETDWPVARFAPRLSALLMESGRKIRRTGS